MNRLSVWGLLLSAGWLCGCAGPGDPVKRAVMAALAPETARETWMPLLKDPSLTAEAVRKGMGADNLTSFLLLAGRDELARLRQDYEWEFGPKDEPVRPDVLARYLTAHGTAVARKDIRELPWTAYAGGVCTGSFSIATSYGLNAKLLFEARPRDGKLVVTKLAVAKKQSSALAEGFPIFEKR